jgi:hypothetical protein
MSDLGFALIDFQGIDLKKKKKASKVLVTVETRNYIRSYLCIPEKFQN